MSTKSRRFARLHVSASTAGAVVCEVAQRLCFPVGCPLLAFRAWRHSSAGDYRPATRSTTLCAEIKINKINVFLLLREGLLPPGG